MITLNMAPNDTGYKQWSCHGSYKLPCKLCRKPPPSAMETQYIIFLGKPAIRTGWMAGTTPHKSGQCQDKSRSDNHTQTSLDLRYLPQIHGRKQISIRCNIIEHWVHLRCAGIRLAQSILQIPGPAIYTKNPDSTHTDITPPHPSISWSNPPTYSPHTPPRPPQPKHRHTSNTSPVPTGLVKPKPNPLIQSPPLSFNAAPSQAHILLHLPHQHCRHHLTLTLSQHTHMQHKQQCTHHINHRIHIGYYNLTDRPKTIT